MHRSYDKEERKMRYRLKNVQPLPLVVFPFAVAFFSDGTTVSSADDMTAAHFEYDFVSRSR